MSEAFEDRIEEVAEEEDFGDSTIFSAPEEKNDRVAKPKLLRRILIGVGALLVLAGVIFGIVKLVKVLAPEESVSSTIEEWYIMNDFVTLKEETKDDGTVKKTESFRFDDVSKVGLKSADLNLEFYSKLPEDKDGSTVWLETTIPQEYTSETTTASFAKAALGLKYVRVINDTVEEGVDYGFAKPLYVISVTPYKGDAFTVTVGKAAPDNSGYYATSSKTGKVYLVRNSYVEELLCEDKMELTKALTVSAFAEADGSAEYYTQSTLAKFDHLYFENKTLGKRYKFEMQQTGDKQVYNTYRITEPVNRPANDTGFVPILELFANGIDSKGLYSVTKTPDDIKKFGLNDPDMSAEIKAGKQERSIAVKLQPDGDYALMASDYDVILRVSAASLTPLKYSEKDIYSVFLFIETITDIDKITIESKEGAKNVFGIVSEYDEEKDNTAIKGVTINGGKATAPEEFQSYYQFLLGITTLSYEQSNLKGKAPYLTITMTKVDKSAATVLKYYEIENGRYQVVVNGEQMGIVGSSSVKNIIKYANNVAAGKAYNS